MTATAQRETVTLAELIALTGCQRGTWKHWAFAAKLVLPDKAEVRDGRPVIVCPREFVYAIRTAREAANKPVPKLPKGW